MRAGRTGRQTILVATRLKTSSTLERETQVKVMEPWFYQNFEDPAEKTPYVSAEGGYQWIWGGPYDASEVLSS